MLRISPEDIEGRLARDNPWWAARQNYRSEFFSSARREYFAPFFRVATDFDVKRAAILLGPRRVGKTVMLHQTVDQLISEGVDPIKVMYVSIDAPVYSRIPLANFLDFLLTKSPPESGGYYVMFDEIQYLPDWEVHLKDLVDRYNNVKFIASGSAAAALQLKSKESGAGRFSDFLLPPLTFYEFVKFLQRDSILYKSEDDHIACNDIDELNRLFVEYLNYGGFPELALNPKIRGQTDQFIKNDIIDKVLLKDLPNLYGIQNIPELNNLFSFLAYNTGQEASLEAISQNSGLSKNSLTNYISYLKSAFLISALPKMPSSSKGILRQRNFKVYIVNPSMRSALFGEVKSTDSELVGHLAESAVLSQWNHVFRDNYHYYYRDKHGNEIDLVSVKQGTFSPQSGVEIKWSDRIEKTNTAEIKGPLSFARKYKVPQMIVTTKTKYGGFTVDGVRITLIPTSLYCLNIGVRTSRAAIEIAWGGLEAAE